MYTHKNGITLRKMEMYDLEIMQELKNESWFGTHRITLNTAEEQLKWYNSINPNTTLFLIANYNVDRVGVYKISNIDWISRSYDSAHDVYKEHRGQKYGHKILQAGVDFGMEVLNMNRINTEVLENNIASQKTALKAGFIQEGVKRKSVFKCGEYLDSITYGMLKEDWKELERVKEYKGICNTSYKPKNDTNYK